MTIARPDDTWLRAQQARADQPPAGPREPLWLGAEGWLVGSVEPALAERLSNSGLVVREVGGGGWRVADGDADIVLSRVARWLHAHGFVSSWRDELLDVPDVGGAARARIERAAVRPLGIATRAVHLVGHAPGGGCWVQQRALDKATDPGLWDTLMGGLIAAGESESQALARETWEEAGLRVADLQALGPAGRLTVRRPVADGYLIEHIAVWSATVPAGLQPANRDGEVARFERLEPAALVQGLAQGLFTLEAGLILAGAAAPG